MTGGAPLQGRPAPGAHHPGRLFALLAALLFLAVPARALTAADASPVVSEDPNAAPVQVSAAAGGTVTLSGEAGTAVTPMAVIEVDGPLVVGAASLARVQARLALTTAPGESLDLSNPETFKAAEVTLGLSRIVGHRALEGGGQVVTTAVTAEAGFSSRLPGEPGPRERLLRHAGVGVRLAELRSGASLAVLYGFDEVAGDRGFGQVLVRGQVPIPATAGALQLVGDATLSIGHHATAKQRDVLRIGVAASLGKLLELIR